MNKLCYPVVNKILSDRRNVTINGKLDNIKALLFIFIEVIMTS